MRATRFEYRHQVLRHLLLVGLSSLSYFCDRVDVVWAVVRNHLDSASWERLVFGLGALMLAASALLETWATAHNHVIHLQDSHTQHQLRLARIFSVLVVGLLLPMSGTIILLTGETILMLRLSFRRDKGAYVLSSPCTSTRWRFGMRDKPLH